MTHRHKILNPILNFLDAVNKTGISLCGKQVKSECLTPTDFQCPLCKIIHSNETDDLADDIADLFRR